MGTRTVQLTIEPAIRHALGENEVDHARKHVLRLAKVAGVVEEHAVDTHIAHRLRFTRPNAAVGQSSFTDRRRPQWLSANQTGCSTDRA